MLVCAAEGADKLRVAGFPDDGAAYYRPVVALLVDGGGFVVCVHVWILAVGLRIRGRLEGYGAKLQEGSHFSVIREHPATTGA